LKRKTVYFKWWNNGTINKKSYTKPGDGWVRGMIKKKGVNI